MKVSAQVECQARLCFGSGKYRARSRIILSRRLSYVLTARHRTLVGLACIIYLLLANYTLPIRYQLIHSVVIYAKINYIVDQNMRYLNMHRYQSTRYETPKQSNHKLHRLRECFCVEHQYPASFINSKIESKT